MEKLYIEYIHNVWVRGYTAIHPYLLVNGGNPLSHPILQLPEVSSKQLHMNHTL
jgi:hypothetical protein